ncbi:signal peptidase I [Peribacillus kribbensis]|uniref:signal peptidase I n=1 Tax=Peribacillus kribbensis TaxID=356658 RepID=UPI0004078045|nr:signal peptidase I [Peribacillus kribbensis]
MKGNAKKEFYSWLKTIAAAVIIVFICRQYVFAPIKVSGSSMLPTLQDQNKMVVSKLSKIQRFDVIVFHAPDADEDYIKRVIGLPGDTVSMKNDVLYVNGHAYKEPYLKRGNQSQYTGDFSLEELFGTSKVPKGTYFVLGDNRPISKDSRIIGFIKQSSVIGEAKYRFYPFNEIGVPK